MYLREALKEGKLIRHPSWYDGSWVGWPDLKHHRPLSKELILSDKWEVKKDDKKGK